MKTLGLVLLPVAWLLQGCAASFVAASMGGVGTAAVATFDCDAHVTVRVRDRAGGERCNVPLRATHGSETRSFGSCGWVSLSEGTWAVRAVGGTDQSELTIEPVEGCDEHVYSVELTDVPTVADETEPTRRTSPESSQRAARGSGRDGA